MSRQKEIQHFINFGGYGFYERLEEPHYILLARSFDQQERYRVESLIRHEQQNNAVRDFESRYSGVTNGFREDHYSNIDDDINDFLSILFDIWQFADERAKQGVRNETVAFYGCKI